MVISKSWTSTYTRTNKSAFSPCNKTQNFTSWAGTSRRPSIFTPVNKFVHYLQPAFFYNKPFSTRNKYILYQWTFYDLILQGLVQQKPALNCHNVIVQPTKVTFNISVLFHTFIHTPMEENAQPVQPSKSRTRILASSVPLQFLPVLYHCNFTLNLVWLKIVSYTWYCD